MTDNHNVTPIVFHQTADPIDPALLLEGARDTGHTIEDCLACLTGTETTRYQKLLGLAAMSRGEAQILRDLLDLDDRPSEASSVPDYTDADYAIPCPDESLVAARIKKGDVLCIKETGTVNNGDLAIIAVDGKPALIRRVYMNDTTTVLSPESPSYEALSFTGEERDRLTILGRVTHFISEIPSQPSLRVVRR